MNAVAKKSACDGCPAQFICRCLRVTEEQLLCALAIEPVETIRDLRERTGAGDGCMSCHRELTNLIERYCQRLDVVTEEPSLQASC